MHPHTFLRTQIRNVLRKSCQNQGSTVFILIFQKTEIAKSACEPKWQGLLAEDALAKLYFGQKSLVTRERRITRSSLRRVNHGTITGTLSLFKILESVPSVQNIDFTWDGKEFIKILGAVEQTESNIHGQFIRIWKILWRSIMESSNLNTSSIRDEWHCRKSRKTSTRRNISSIATLRIGRMMVGWFHGMLLLSAKCPRPPGKWENAARKTIWRTFPRANNSYWGSGWISSRDFSRLHQSGKTVLLGIFLGYEMIEAEFGQEIFWLRIWKIWKSWTHQKFNLEESTRKKYW